MSHGETFNLIPNRMEFCHGQISIETATYSLDHLHTIPIQTGLVDIKTGPSVFGPACSYMATGLIIDFGSMELNFHFPPGIFETVVG